MTETDSEKCVIRRFCPCANITKCTYSNLDGIAYYTHTPRLDGQPTVLGCRLVQQVSA